MCQTMNRKYPFREFMSFLRLFFCLGLAVFDVQLMTGQQLSGWEYLSRMFYFSFLLLLPNLRSGQKYCFFLVLPYYEKKGSLETLLIINSIS